MKFSHDTVLWYPLRSILYPEGGGGRFYWNVDTCLTSNVVPDDHNSKYMFIKGMIFA